MIFENVYKQFSILYITYNQWRMLPLPFGGQRRGKIFQKIINLIWENFEQALEVEKIKIERKRWN